MDKPLVLRRDMVGDGEDSLEMIGENRPDYDDELVLPGIVCVWA